MSPPPRTRRRVVEVPDRKPSVELRSIRVVFEADPDPDVSFLEQEEFADRLADYRDGEFNFVRVRAEADVRIADVEQLLTSAGLGGIESDTTQEDLDRLVEEEWVALRNVLKAVGIPTAQLPLEVDRKRIEWRT